MTFKIDENGNLQKYTKTGRKRKNWKHRYREMSRKFLKDKCENCNSTKNLTIDHIIPLREQILITKENCQTLCRECHNKVEYERWLKKVLE